MLGGEIAEHSAPCICPSQLKLRLGSASVSTVNLHSAAWFLLKLFELLQ